MKIGAHLHVLKIPAWGGQSLYLGALKDDASGSVTLVDGALPGALPDIKSAMQEAGLAWPSLSQVLVTHHDFDHIGGLPEILAAAENMVRVYAHQEEKPYVEGTKPLLKSDPAVRAQMQRNMPAGQTLGPAHPIENPPKVPVSGLLTDGQVLDLAGGIVVIHLPGHTPGHLAYYCQESRTLIAGDAMNAADGRLLPPAPEHSVDIIQAYASLKKLLDLDIAAVLCYHGGICTDDIKGQIQKLIDNSPFKK